MADRLSATTTTARLLLRRADEADLDDYCRRIYCDPSVMRMLPGRVALSLEEARVRARTNLIEHWVRHGFGPWLIILLESRHVIGHCGLRFWPDSPDVEVLYALEHDAWGRGYATEAGSAAVRAAFDELELDRLIAGADAENAASRHVLDKLGLRPWQRRDFHGLTLEMYEMSRVEWQSVQGLGPPREQ
jgi:ribosomal-protein-alanine N-acetyltransferase